MSGPNNSQNRIVLLKQGITAGGYFLIALAALFGAYWIYNNPETGGFIMGVGGLEIILVGIAIIAGYYAVKKSPFKL